MYEKVNVFRMSKPSWRLAFVCATEVSAERPVLYFNQYTHTPSILLARWSVPGWPDRGTPHRYFGCYFTDGFDHRENLKSWRDLPSMLKKVAQNLHVTRNIASGRRYYCKSPCNQTVMKTTNKYSVISVGSLLSQQSPIASPPVLKYCVTNLSADGTTVQEVTIGEIVSDTQDMKQE